MRRKEREKSDNQGKQEGEGDKEGLSLGKKREWRRKAKGRKGAGRIIEENKNKEEAK